MSTFSVKIAGVEDLCHAQSVSELLESCARERGTGRGWREPSFIAAKILEGDAIIALQEDQLAGFCYLQSYEEGKFLAHSGLVIHPDFRQKKVARQIKILAMELSASKYPGAKIFSITTSPAVLKVNQEMGYKAVPYSELPSDQKFWEGCQSCPNFQILQSQQQKMCLCTALVKMSETLNNPSNLTPIILQNHE